MAEQSLVVAMQQLDLAKKDLADSFMPTRLQKEAVSKYELDVEAARAAVAAEQAGGGSAANPAEAESQLWEARKLLQQVERVLADSFMPTAKEKDAVARARQKVTECEGNLKAATSAAAEEEQAAAAPPSAPGQGGDGVVAGVLALCQGGASDEERLAALTGGPLLSALTQAAAAKRAAAYGSLKSLVAALQPAEARALLNALVAAALSSPGEGERAAACDSATRVASQLGAAACCGTGGAFQLHQALGGKGKEAGLAKLGALTLLAKVAAFGGPASVGQSPAFEADLTRAGTDFVPGVGMGPSLMGLAVQVRVC
jgi:hypothetical protein